MKSILIFCTVSFFCIIMAVLPLIAGITEHYCPIFKPEEVQVYSQAEKAWVIKKYSNGFLGGSLVVGEFACIIMIITSCIATAEFNKKQ